MDNDGLCRSDYDRQAVGGLICDPSQLDECKRAEEVLVDPKRVMLVRLMREMRANHEWIDLVTLGDALEARGYDPYAFDLAGMVAGVESVYATPYYFEKLADLERRRRWKGILVDGLTAVHSSNGSCPAELLDVSERLAAAVKESGSQASALPEILTAADALAQREAIESIVDRLIIPGSVNAIYAPPGTGKTYVLLFLAVCVALGVPFLGLATTQGAVLIIDEESGQRRIMDRLAEVLRGQQADESTPVFVVSLAGFNFRESASLAPLEALVEKVGARLVIVDALADVMLGGDENAVKDTQPVFHGLRAVADRTGAAILVIHHSNRAGSYRGSSAIPGAIDVLLELSRDAESTHVDLTTVKNRDGEPLKLGATLDWHDGIFELRPAIANEGGPLYSKSERYVMRYLSEHTVATVDAIKAAADSCTPEAARRAIYSLADKRVVRRADRGGPGTTAAYTLVAQPCESEDDE